MQILCRYGFVDQPELDVGRTIWSFIAGAEKLSCVSDGSMFQVAAISGSQEVPLAEVGIGLWRKRGVLAEVLAGYAPSNRDNYRARIKTFSEKTIAWLGD